MADAEIFLGLRPALFGVAYRMLGSATEADDVLEEGFLRWRFAPDNASYPVKRDLALARARRTNS